MIKLIRLVILTQTFLSSVQGKYYEKNSKTSRFWLSRTKKSWQHGKQDCEKMGRKLYSPRYKGDFLRIRNRVPISSNLNARTWVGFTDAGREGTWSDLNKKTVKDIQWAHD